MDALSRLLMLNAPQGTIDKNCVLGSDWQLPHGAGELSVIRWHALTQGAAKLEMPTGEIFTLRPGNVVLLPQNSAHRLSKLRMFFSVLTCAIHSRTARVKNVAQIWLHSASTPGIANLDSCCKNGIASLSQLYSTLWLTGAKNSVSGKDVKK